MDLRKVVAGVLTALLTAAVLWAFGLERRLTTLEVQQRYYHGEPPAEAR